MQQLCTRTFSIRLCPAINRRGAVAKNLIFITSSAVNTSTTAEEVQYSQTTSKFPSRLHTRGSEDLGMILSSAGFPSLAALHCPSYLYPPTVSSLVARTRLHSECRSRFFPSLRMGAPGLPFQTIRLPSTHVQRSHVSKICCVAMKRLMQYL